MVQIPILANKYLKIIVMDTLKHVQKKMNLMKERISHVNRNDLTRFTHTFSPPPRERGDILRRDYQKPSRGI